MVRRTPAAALGAVSMLMVGGFFLAAVRSRTAGAHWELRRYRAKVWITTVAISSTEATEGYKVGRWWVSYIAVARRSSRHCSSEALAGRALCTKPPRTSLPGSPLTTTCRVSRHSQVGARGR